MNILNIYRLDFVIQGPIWYLLSDQFGGILSVTHIWLTFAILKKNYQAFCMALRYCSWHSYGDAHETQNQTWQLPKALNFS